MPTSLPCRLKFRNSLLAKESRTCRGCAHLNLDQTIRYCALHSKNGKRRLGDYRCKYYKDHS
jgi:hypothetical protein